MDVLIIIVLIIAAVILFLVELFVIPGISFAGIAALGCIILPTIMHLPISVRGRIYHIGRIGCGLRRLTGRFHAFKNTGQAGSKERYNFQNRQQCRK